VVNFTCEKETQYLRNSSLVGPQTQSGFFGERNSPLSVQEIEPQKVKFIMHQSFDDDHDDDDDIIIHDNKQGTCMLIDVAIPGVRNAIKKEAKKILKYKDLITEIQCMWNVEVKVIPVILLATGTISNSLRQYLSNIPGKQEIKELQKTAILGTAHTYCGKC